MRYNIKKKNGHYF